MNLVKLSQLGRRREVHLDYDGEEIIIGFRPAAINDLWLNRLRQLDDNDRTGYAQLLAEVLVDWNLVDEGGQTITPSAEILQILPADLTAQIVMAVMESLSPRPTKSAS